MITKRPERIRDHLPYDWNGGWSHVEIAVTCENQEMLDKRMPVYLDVPMIRRSVMIEPMLESINLMAYIDQINSVSVGGESGPDARPCDFSWVQDIYRQCRERDISFYYHQTGARLLKNGKEYHIPRSEQHIQANKAMSELER